MVAAGQRQRVAGLADQLVDIVDAAGQHHVAANHQHHLGTFHHAGRQRAIGQAQLQLPGVGGLQQVAVDVVVLPLAVRLAAYQQRDVIILHSHAAPRRPG